MRSSYGTYLAHYTKFTNKVAYLKKQLKDLKRVIRMNFNKFLI